MKRTMYAVPMIDSKSKPMPNMYWAVFLHEENARKFNPNGSAPIEVVASIRKKPNKKVAAKKGKK